MRTARPRPFRAFDRPGRRLLALTLSCLGIMLSAGVAEAVDVPIYGRFETTIDYVAVTGSGHTYSDPFYGIDLNATFVAPSGRRISWFGFFDGNGSTGQSGNVWRLRFMPDEVGGWSYTWWFSDGSASGSGVFQAKDTTAMPGKPGPLRHDPNIHQWMITADGSRHIFTNMYSHENAAAWGETSPYQQPGTAVAATQELGCDFVANFHPNWAANPVSSQDPSIYTDTTTFTPRIQGWRLLEGLYDAAYDETVWVYDWDGFYSGNGLLDLHEKPMSLQFEVIRYILARSAPYYNVVFNIGFELCDYSEVPEWPTVRAALVQALDPWDHPIAAHQCNQEWYQYPDATDIGMSALQAQDAFHERALDVWTSPAEPNPHLSEGVWNAPWQEPGTEASHRHDLWESVTGGMSVFLWPRDSDAGIESFKHVNTFLGSGVRWWTTSPRDDLVVAGGARLLADPGHVYIAYDQSGSSFDLAMEAGWYQARWFDPETGSMGVWQAFEITSSGSRTFTKPGADDWVLEIGDENATVGTPNAATAPITGRVERLAPNPFSMSTAVHFSVGAAGRVRVDVYAVDGRRVRRLVDRAMHAGEHVVSWDGRDDRGEVVASGTYLVRMRDAGGEGTRRSLVIH